MERLYMLRQMTVIVMLFLSGWVFNSLLGRTVKSKKNKIWINSLLLAYPSGLALWGLIGFGMLVANIPYRLPFIAITYAVIYGLVSVFAVKNKAFTDEKKTALSPVWIVAVVIFVAGTAYISCSGIIPVSMSNDSYYYYSLYPQTIVSKGCYLRCFDVFLTDVGQTTAIIGCLPWFFGFEETFGIQLFLGFNLIGIYAFAVSKLSRKWTLPVFSVVALATSTPFVVMTRWILANAYFMTYLFILFVLTIELSETEGQINRRDVVLVALYVAMLSMMRMEGGMMAGLLTLCAIGIPALSNRILLCYAMPIAVTQVLYYATIYLRIKVDPLYSFLSTTNVFVMLGFVLAIIIYLCCFRKRKFMSLIEKWYSQFFIGALLLGNILLALVSSSRYLGNLKFFAENILLQNGWGYFVLFVIVVLILLPVSKDFLKKIDFSVTFTIGFVLFALAVSWARDGTLRVGIGDSGNRVLLQIVPFVMYCLTSKIADYLNDLENQDA